jgi:hypothetical protein
MKKIFKKNFMKKIFKITKRLNATLPFNITNAKRQINVAYYCAQAKNMKQFTHLETEKRRRSTHRWDLDLRPLGLGPPTAGT